MVLSLVRRGEGGGEEEEWGGGGEERLHLALGQAGSQSHKYGGLTSTHPRQMDACEDQEIKESGPSPPVPKRAHTLSALTRPHPFPSTHHDPSACVLCASG